MAKVKKRDTVLKVTQASDLVSFLQTKLGGATRNRIKGLLAHRVVQVNGVIQTRCDTPLNKGQVVTIVANKGNQQLHHPKLRIVFEDDNLIVVEKKQGLLTVPANLKSQETTVFSLLKHYVKQQDIHNGIYVVHRLDRETSGLLVFAKTSELQEYMRTYWQELVQQRAYVALVEGEMPQKEGQIRTWLSEDPQTGMSYSSPVDDGGKLSITNYKVLRIYNQSPTVYSLVELNLETGRTNQIRVHLASIGHPVLGDRKYGHGNESSPLDRLCLHAKGLRFIHPVTEKMVSFETAIPSVFNLKSVCTPSRE